MTLNKNQLINSIYNHYGASKQKSIELVKCLLELIKSTLESGEDVLISGFGQILREREK